MGSHPANLAIRFIIELIALGAGGYWGYKQGVGWSKYLFAAGIVVLLALIWGTFAVPDDPSRSGSAPIPVPGMLRLAIELSFFAFACWCLYDLGFIKWSLGLGIVVFLHCAISYDRIAWLVEQ